MKQADLQLFGFMMRRYVFILVLLVGATMSNASELPMSRNSEFVPAAYSADEPYVSCEMMATRAPGDVTPTYIATSSTGLVIDAALNLLSGNMDLNVTSSVFFRGKNAASMIFDGQGFFLQMPRASAPFLQVAARKRVVLKNIVLKDFSPEHLKLLSAASLVFGDNVYLQLADTVQPISTSWVFDGIGAVVDGRGGSLQLSVADAILVNDAKEVTFKNVRLLGVSSTGTTHRMRCAGPLSNIILDDSTVMINSFFNVTQGSVTARNDVTFKGLRSTFSWTSTGTLRLDPFACLKFDYGTTFSYDAASKTRTNVVFADASSLLYLNNATVYVTRTGLTLAGGSMYCENIVTLASEAQTEAEALILDKSLQAFVPNGSTVEIKGKVVYQ